MPENKGIPEIELPMKLKWDESPDTFFFTPSKSIEMRLIDYPKGDFRLICCNMIMSTWNQNPWSANYSDDFVQTTFNELLSGKVLPNAMEYLAFTFLLDGLTHIEISHLLRHRLMYGIHALCSGDRDLRDDDAMIPESILNSEFRTRYTEMTMQAKRLYADMIDSKKISLMDARYILTRNHLYYYYFTMNLKDCMNFINQRKCSQEQPETDNIIAHKMFDLIASVIPEIKDVLSLKCDKNCHYVRAANTGKATNLYLPDKNHDLFDYNPKNFVYQKTRKQMGINYEQPE